MGVELALASLVEFVPVVLEGRGRGEVRSGAHGFPGLHPWRRPPSHCAG